MNIPKDKKAYIMSCNSIATRGAITVKYTGNSRVGISNIKFAFIN
jgi:hypothetical protein